jgi:hypothetical protein
MLSGVVRSINRWTKIHGISGWLLAAGWNVARLGPIRLCYPFQQMFRLCRMTVPTMVNGRLKRVVRIAGLLNR